MIPKQRYTEIESNKIDTLLRRCVISVSVKTRVIKGVSLYLGMHDAHYCGVLLFCLRDVSLRVRLFHEKK